MSLDRLPRRMAWVFFSLFIAACLPGCGRMPDDARGVRTSVSGTVMLNDAPLSNARIVFICESPGGQLKASALVNNGLFFFPEDAGPLPGTARVEIYPVELELEELEAQRQQDPKTEIDLTPVDIPPNYNIRSTLTAEVKADSDQNVFSFELSSRPTK